MTDRDIEGVRIGCRSEDLSTAQALLRAWPAAYHLPDFFGVEDGDNYLDGDNYFKLTATFARAFAFILVTPLQWKTVAPEALAERLARVLTRYASHLTEARS